MPSLPTFDPHWRDRRRRAASNGHHQSPAAAVSAPAPPLPSPPLVPAQPFVLGPSPVTWVAPPATGPVTPSVGEPRAWVPQAPASSGELDYQLARELATLVSERVSAELRGQEVSNAEQRRVTEEVARQLVRQHVDNRVQAGDVIPAGVEEQLAAAVVAYLVGLGPRLQPLVDDPDVENIQVNGFDNVRVEYADGRLDQTSFTAAESDEELISILQRAAARGGQTERTLSTSKPILHLRLPGGDRMAAIHVVTPRPVLAIRRHRIKKVSLADMVARHSMTDTLASFLTAAVRGHLNIMIAGLPNAGKSTLLRAIASVVPADEWFATMETVYELGLNETGQHRWVVPFEEREGHGELGANGRPQGEMALSDMFADMLRLSVTRVIVGEVRAAEVVPMFDAMSTTQGSLSTIHARHAHATFDRLAELLMRYGASRNRDGAYLTIANALDLVVFVNLERRPGAAPRRYVSHVLEVNGVGESGGIARSDLFAPPRMGELAAPTGVQPIGRIRDALIYGGFDPGLLTGGSWEGGQR